MQSLESLGFSSFLLLAIMWHSLGQTGSRARFEVSKHIVINDWNILRFVAQLLSVDMLANRQRFAVIANVGVGKDSVRMCMRLSMRNCVL